MQKTQGLEIIKDTPLIGDIVVLGYEDYHVVIRTIDNHFSCNTWLHVSRNEKYNIIRGWWGVKYFANVPIPSMKVEVNKDMWLDKYILCNWIINIKIAITNETKKFLQDYFHKLCAESPSEKQLLLKTISSIHQVEGLTDTELSSLHKLLRTDEQIKIVTRSQMIDYLSENLWRTNELYRHLQTSQNSLQG